MAVVGCVSAKGGIDFFLFLFSNRIWMISGQKLIYWAFKPWWKYLICLFHLIRRGRYYVFDGLHGKGYNGSDLEENEVFCV